uniref:Uncharacterized protein n=1 Tax=Rhizophora mucronata TaxID=61149 RepID=A0A2P2PBD8_RHIMU
MPRHLDRFKPMLSILKTQNNSISFNCFHQRDGTHNDGKIEHYPRFAEMKVKKI